MALISHDRDRDNQLHPVKVSALPHHSVIVLLVIISATLNLVLYTTGSQTECSSFSAGVDVHVRGHAAAIP